MLSQELLNILACPICNGELRVGAHHEALACRACRLIFPVRNGIPVLLPDQAEKAE